MSDLTICMKHHECKTHRWMAPGGDCVKCHAMDLIRAHWLKDFSPARQGRGIDITGSALIGYVKCAYPLLVTLFGEPHRTAYAPTPSGYLA